MSEKDKNKKKKKDAEAEQEKTSPPEDAKEILPPLDFSSLFLPFYTQALIKLGAAEDPILKKIDEDIDLAKRLIDILDLLKEKTKGNLKPEEEQLLSNGLHQLKLIYMEKTKTINL